MAKLPAEDSLRDTEIACLQWSMQNWCNRILRVSSFACFPFLFYYVFNWNKNNLICVQHGINNPECHNFFRFSLFQRWILFFLRKILTHWSYLCSLKIVFTSFKQPVFKYCCHRAGVSQHLFTGRFTGLFINLIFYPRTCKIIIFCVKMFYLRDTSQQTLNYYQL